MDEIIRTGLGTFSKAKFNALLDVRAVALDALRTALRSDGHTEVSTSSLVNIAGSCENPHASFKLDYYGRPAHLSQSAQLQLEALVIRLRRPVFTVNNSFREENFDDPDAMGRRLSEFTLVEAERPYGDISSDRVLAGVIERQERVVKHALSEVLKNVRSAIRILGGDLEKLAEVADTPFKQITYDAALRRLGASRDLRESGADFGIRQERALLEIENGIPLFVTHHPAHIKFFNMKRTADGERAYSVDLLMPPLGETVGGAVREENGEAVRTQLHESDIARFVDAAGGAVEESFGEYLQLFVQEDEIVRGGFGVGFERFVAFLINSNDILNTISYRTMQPSTADWIS
jgi:asparaginyl-tRNA synthetase